LVACGGAHTLVKSTTQEVFSFGLNDKGQLGLGIKAEIIPIPSKIKNFTSFKISKLACSGKEIVT
jgi:alpha-tubulin suppressor-like RCC1 family protein